MTDDLPAFLDRRPLVFSFTMLHTYRDICPNQAAQRYVYKSTPYVETEAMAWGNKVHAAFEYRIGGQKPLPLDMQQWESFATPFDGKDAKTEQKLGVDRQGYSCKFFSDKPQVFLRGKLDCTIINGTTAYLADWKTGGSKYEDPFELAVGALLLHAANPQLTKIVGQFAWLKENRMSGLHDVSNTAETWNEVSAITGNIERDKAAGVFEKRQGPLCRWCDVYKCENNSNPKKP